MLLCFGTFAKILKLCTLRVKDATDTKLVGTMTQMVDPSCGYIYNPQAVSKILACKQNLSEGQNRSEDGPLSQVVQKALEIDTADKRDALVLKFKNKVARLIDEDKKKRAVLALIDVIRNDSTLENEQKYKFERCIGTTKENLLVQTEYAFPELLTGIFLYTVTAVKNRAGEDYVKLITETYVDNFNDPNFFWISETLTLKKIPALLRERFEDATEKYDFADYMLGVPSSSLRVTKFITFVQASVLDDMYRDDNRYKDIVKFCKSLDTYNAVLGMIRSSTLEYYTKLRLDHPFDPFDIIEIIKKDKEQLIVKRSTLTPEPVEHIGPSTFPVKSADINREIMELDSLIIQLGFVDTYYHEQHNIFSLYSQICDGKALKPHKEVSLC